MQHEAAAGLHRASLEDLQRLGSFGQLDLVGLLDDVELHQQPRKIDAAGRAINDNAHRALGGVGAEVNHRTLKARIAHHRHGNQQLAIEIAMVVRPDGAAGGSTANRFQSIALRAHR